MAVAVIKTTKDGRTIRTAKDYGEFRFYVWQIQRCRCKLCRKMTFVSAPIENDNSFHLHHKHGRGLGGGKRDDTTEECVGLCGRCHRREHELLNKGAVEIVERADRP